MKWVVSLMVSLISSLALADAPAAAPRDGVTPFIPLLMIFGVFYFLILRPQQKSKRNNSNLFLSLKEAIW